MTDSSIDSVTITLVTKGTRTTTNNVLFPDTYNGSRTAKIRISRDRKQVNTEGELPDETPFLFSARAEGSMLTIGHIYTDATSIPSPAKSMSYKVVGVVTASGRAFANILAEYTGDLSGTYETWVDLETGIVAKSLTRLKVLRPDGKELLTTGSSWFIDGAGQRWLE